LRIIALLLALGLSLPLGAQDSTDNPVQSTKPANIGLYRNPRRALILGSIIPGAGYMYAGEYWHGVLAYEGTVGGIGTGILVFMVNKCTFQLWSDCKPGPEWPHQAAGVALVGLGIWEWVSTARDAFHAAERANVRHAAESQRASLLINPMGGPSNATQIGMSVHW
jgi:hypothetical protein